mgnify:FL=1|tara:strand:- start:1506 stop:2093 length:588 start_codon:yes stop_codon:yes gene_type:complete
MKFKIYKFKSVTSTNDVALNLIKDKKKNSGLIYSDVQTKGRGTKGKNWVSIEGNLFCSLFFPLENEHPTFDQFSIINPIIISDVIKRFCSDGEINLKFPNDIFLNGKKICGLLQEVITIENRKFLIVGIGLNIESNPNINSKYRATNILFETKKKPAIKEIVNLIISSYENFFSKLNIYNYEDFKKKANLMAFNL